MKDKEWEEEIDANYGHHLWIHISQVLYYIVLLHPYYLQLD